MFLFVLDTEPFSDIIFVAVLAGGFFRLFSPPHSVDQCTAPLSPSLPLPASLSSKVCKFSVRCIVLKLARLANIHFNLGKKQHRGSSYKFILFRVKIHAHLSNNINFSYITPNCLCISCLNGLV